MNDEQRAALEAFKRALAAARECGGNIRRGAWVSEEDLRALVAAFDEKPKMSPILVKILTSDEGSVIVISRTQFNELRADPAMLTYGWWDQTPSAPDYTINIAGRTVRIA